MPKYLRRFAVKYEIQLWNTANEEKITSFTVKKENEKRPSMILAHDQVYHLQDNNIVHNEMIATCQCALDTSGWTKQEY